MTEKGNKSVTKYTNVGEDGDRRQHVSILSNSDNTKKSAVECRALMVP